MKKELRKPYPGDKLNSERYAKQRSRQKPEAIEDRVQFLSSMNSLLTHYRNERDWANLELLARMYKNIGMPKIAAAVRSCIPAKESV